MKRKGYAFAALSALALVFLGITFLSFCLTYLAPSDAAQIQLNKTGVAPTEELLEQTREEMGLNRPLLVRYGDWLIHVLRGDMGTSLRNESPVAEELLDALCENRFEVQDRMMLKGTVYKNGKKAAESAALNDIVVSREGRLRILKLRIYVDGRFLNEYSADGMIVSTPTGSTAYNLSAGGPIAQPDGQLMILTPVCPHTLTSRTIVFGPESRIRIEIPETAEGGQTAAFDGDLVVKLSGGDYLEITRAETAVRVLRLDNRSFLDILKDKMYEA